MIYNSPRCLIWQMSLTQTHPRSAPAADHLSVYARSQNHLHMNETNFYRLRHRKPRWRLFVRSY